MRKFEYLIESKRFRPSFEKNYQEQEMEYFKKMGENGWELSSIVPPISHPMMGFSSPIYYWKKEKIMKKL